MKPVPAAAPEGSGLDLKAFQNLGYTGEWFVFAGFVLFMWFRLVRREAEALRDIEPRPRPGGPRRCPGGPGGPGLAGPRRGGHARTVVGPRRGGAAVPWRGYDVASTPVR